MAKLLELATLGGPSLLEKERETISARGIRIRMTPITERPARPLEDEAELHLSLGHIVSNPCCRGAFAHLTALGRDGERMPDTAS
jgi:hypothetical protein